MRQRIGDGRWMLDMLYTVARLWSYDGGVQQRGKMVGKKV
jgi:hypothetical protein